MILLELCCNRCLTIIFIVRYMSPKINVKKL